MRSSPSRYVVCLENRGHRESLVVRRLYPVYPDPIAERHGMIRIVDESGEDYVYPKAMFANVGISRSTERKLEAAR